MFPPHGKNPVLQLMQGDVIVLHQRCHAGALELHDSGRNLFGKFVQLRNNDLVRSGIHAYPSLFSSLRNCTCSSSLSRALIRASCSRTTTVTFCSTSPPVSVNSRAYARRSVGE